MNPAVYMTYWETHFIQPTGKPPECCEGNRLQFILYKVFWLDIKDDRFASWLYNWAGLPVVYTRESGFPVGYIKGAIFQFNTILFG